MDLKVIFKLLIYFILCFLIVSMIEHGSQNFGKEFIKKCCSFNERVKNVNGSEVI